MINLRPSGVVWETKQLFMKSDRCHNRDIYKDRKSIHYNADDEKLNKGLLVRSSTINSAKSYDITLTKNYISIVPVRVISEKYQYDISMEEFLDPSVKFKIVCNNFCSSEKMTDLESEIRIFKNKKISYVLKIKNKFYCLTKLNELVNEESYKDSSRLVQVQSDSQIEQLGEKITKTHRTLANVLGLYDLYSHCNFLSNVENTIVSHHYSYSGVVFSTTLQEKLKNFLGYKNLIINWACLEDATIAHVAEKTISGYTVKSDPSGKITFDRQGDYLIISQKNTANGKDSFVLFNTKEKTCFRSNQYQGKLIPFNIGNECSRYSYSSTFDIREKWNNETRRYEEVNEKIVFNKPQKEVFKGTIIEFLLNSSKEKKQTKFPTQREEIITVEQIISCKNSKTINLLLAMMICGKYKFYEQLAKSELFNLFLWFVNLKISKTKISDAWLSCYNEKGSNLKAALGLNMAQLRFLDDYLKTKENNYQANIRLKCLSEMGLTVNNNLDLKSFEFFVKYATKPQDSYYYYYNHYGREALSLVMQQMLPKQQIEFIKKYCPKLFDNDDNLQVINDYFRSRKQLADLGQDISGYPISPEKSTVFLRYTAGMRMHTFRYRPEINSQADFLKVISETYKNYQFAFDDNNQVTGAILTLSPIEHMCVLHDELAKICAVYADKIVSTQFAKAVERVKPFEFKDEKLGLEIIAPKDINDIREEGRVLSHCVASYIDPICKGSENIMFIRRLDRPNDPYFTLEIIDEGSDKDKITKGQIRQVHCFRNGNPTKEGIASAFANSEMPVYDEPRDIIGFLSKWVKAQKEISSGSIKERYGALGYIR